VQRKRRVSVAFESLDEEPHKAYVDFSESHRTNGYVEAPREYLIIVGTRR
jgi:hypothetical protein